MFNEAEDLSPIDVNNIDTVEDTVIKGHTRSISAHLPRENIEYDLSEQEKVCPHDQTPLARMGTEDHEQLEIIPAQIKAIRINAINILALVVSSTTSPQENPNNPLKRDCQSWATCLCATQKYADALPLYRQTAIFKRIRVTLDHSNLANWMVRCGELVQPLINLLTEKIREKPVVHMDETTLQCSMSPTNHHKAKIIYG